MAEEKKIEQKAFSSDKKFSKTVADGKRARNDREKGGRRRDNKPAEPKEFDEIMIELYRVTRVVKGGRRFRFKALVVVGDHKNRVGVGVAKGQDVQLAVAKATEVAKKAIITFPLENGTIPHEVEGKLDGAHVLIKPAAPGTGLIAGGAMHSVLGVTGATNLICKNLGSDNKVNVSYAVVDALSKLVPREEWIGAKKVKKEEKKG